MRKHDDQKSMTRAVARESRKWRILVVDDEQDITTIFRTGLERRGFEVDIYNDPVQALSEFRPGRYDLLLLDVRMPGMTGFELYQELRKRDKSVKVCFLTAFETYRKEFSVMFPALDKVKCFLKKPITIADLVERLGTLLESG